MSSLPEATPGAPLRIERSVYGGDGLASTPAGEPVPVPFALAGELVQTMGPRQLPAILEAARGRVNPRCVHFGVCGGCQYQMASGKEQLQIKTAILHDLLRGAGLSGPPLPEVVVHASPEPYGYRNRIRLRVRQEGGRPRLGYSVRGTQEFLPVVMCPIAAPLLWRAAEAILRLSAENRDAARWLEVATELELFCTAGESHLQVNLLCTERKTPEPGSFTRLAEALKLLCPELSSAGALRVDPRTGRTLASVAEWGAGGLPYPVGDEIYWITRGGFFQVNRFLLPRLVELVCGTRTGALAWDLFAGVGLFSRVLARHFAAVTAVEANPTAAGDLRRALARLGAQHRAVEATTLEFLKQAGIERDRPGLVVLDPPRAGAGEEACRLLAELRPAEIVYLSCDPTTLGRDLAVLTRSGYAITDLHLIDLFPQTFHLETLVVLRRA